MLQQRERQFQTRGSIRCRHANKALHPVVDTFSRCVSCSRSCPQKPFNCKYAPIRILKLKCCRGCAIPVVVRPAVENSCGFFVWGATGQQRLDCQFAFSLPGQIGGEVNGESGRNGTQPSDVPWHRDCPRRPTIPLAHVPVPSIPAILHFRRDTVTPSP
jgi:hypothetical protein